MPGAAFPRFEHRDSGDREPLKPPDLIEHFFRHDYGRLVATLARRVGVQHLEIIEDAVQTALMVALHAWTEQAPPEEPAAWLHRVAYNHLLQDLRQRSGRWRILEGAADPVRETAGHPENPVFSEEIRDDMLRMLFVCCDETIPSESRLVLALKTLCGFSTAEIALRLFTSEANVYKRLGRAREHLRKTSLDRDTPPLETLRTRLPSVHGVLYLLFNEGYLSADADQAIRRELCEEAIRLATLLAEHPVGAVPESFALLALMHFHSARLDSRTNGMGGLLLLEEQDRTRWDAEEIQLAAQWLKRSAAGNVFSRFHAEAGIAAEHCFAASFRETRWKEIADLYAMLERISPSPLHTLNRAVAVAEWKGPEAGLELLENLAPPSWLSGSYLWDGVLADLHLRAGHVEAALQHRNRALESSPTDAVRRLLRRRLKDA
jgi:RNA polymerase sigma factor (sigma-70 family)